MPDVRPDYEAWAAEWEPGAAPEPGPGAPLAESEEWLKVSTERGLPAAEARRRLALQAAGQRRRQGWLTRQLRPKLYPALAFPTAWWVTAGLTAAGALSASPFPRERAADLALILTMAGGCLGFRRAGERRRWRALFAGTSVAAKRDGRWARVRADAVVPGDVLRLRRSELALCDARVLDEPCVVLRRGRHVLELEVGERLLAGDVVAVEAPVVLVERTGAETAAAQADPPCRCAASTHGCDTVVLLVIVFAAGVAPLVTALSFAAATKQEQEATLVVCAAAAAASGCVWLLPLLLAGVDQRAMDTLAARGVFARRLRWLRGARRADTLLLSPGASQAAHTASIKTLIVGGAAVSPSAFDPSGTDWDLFGALFYDAHNSVAHPRCASREGAVLSMALALCFGRSGRPEDDDLESKPDPADDDQFDPLPPLLVNACNAAQQMLAKIRMPHAFLHEFRQTAGRAVLMGEHSFYAAHYRGAAEDQSPLVALAGPAALLLPACDRYLWDGSPRALDGATERELAARVLALEQRDGLQPVALLLTHGDAALLERVVDGGAAPPRVFSLAAVLGVAAAGREGLAGLLARAGPDLRAVAVLAQASAVPTELRDAAGGPHVTLSQAAPDEGPEAVGAALDALPPGARPLVVCTAAEYPMLEHVLPEAAPAVLLGDAQPQAAWPADAMLAASGSLADVGLLLDHRRAAAATGSALLAAATAALLLAHTAVGLFADAQLPMGATPGTVMLFGMAALLTAASWRDDPASVSANPDPADDILPPPPRELCQLRLRPRTWLARVALPTAPFCVAMGVAQLLVAADAGFPAAALLGLGGRLREWGHFPLHCRVSGGAYVDAAGNADPARDPRTDPPHEAFPLWRADGGARVEACEFPPRNYDSGVAHTVGMLPATTPNDPFAMAGTWNAAGWRVPSTQAAAALAQERLFEWTPFASAGRGWWDADWLAWPLLREGVLGMGEGLSEADVFAVQPRGRWNLTALMNPDDDPFGDWSVVNARQSARDALKRYRDPDLGALTDRAHPWALFDPSPLLSCAGSGRAAADAQHACQNVASRQAQLWVGAEVRSATCLTWAAAHATLALLFRSRRPWRAQPRPRAATVALALLPGLVVGLCAWHSALGFAPVPPRALLPAAAAAAAAVAVEWGMRSRVGPGHRRSVLVPV